MAPISPSEETYLDEEQRKILLALARTAIEYGVQYKHPLLVRVEEYPLSLRQPRATFVTLKKQRDLRGCIGTCQPVRLLVEDVAHNAYAAAFLDPRFPPLGSGELTDLQIHISLLSVPEALIFSSPAELLAQLRPGMDGLLLEEGSRKGTLLPAVWETLPEAEVFLRQLKLKAGLPADYWSDSLKVYRYTAESIE